MKKFIKDVGLYLGIGSGGLTIVSYFSKKKSKQELIQACEKEISQQELKIASVEQQRQIDLSQVKKWNHDCGAATKESIEYIQMADAERSKYGENSASYEYYINKYKEDQNRALDIQEKIDKYIDEAKNSNKFMSD
jgi:hypothetical protein